MTTTPHRVRLGIVLSHPTQYYSPWFQYVAAQTTLAIRVFYLWDFGVTLQRDPKFGKPIKWDVDLLSGYDLEFVPNVSSRPGTDHFWGLRNPGITKRLEQWRPDALLLFGYKWATHLRVIAWARRRRVPILFRGDSHFLGRGAPTGLTRLVLKTVFRQFAAVLPVGRVNADYMTALGVPAPRQFFAPHSVNAARFNPADSTAQAQASELRARLRIATNDIVVLFAGKFVPEKQPLALLRAFIECAIPNAVMVFVGDGPEKTALVKCAETASAGRVHFLPFANQTEMPSRYLAAQIFALPSRGFYETWGLAVNEAMHLGVPCLVSDRVGCQQDLVTDGVTGWTFVAEDPASLRQALARAATDIADAARRDAFHHAVRTRIAAYTYEQTTAGLLRALATVQPQAA